MSDVTPETELSHTPQQPVGALSRWLAPAALLVAVVAVALAIWALTSASSGAPAAAKQAGDPKMRVCTALDTVAKAVTGQTHNDLGPDPVAQAAVAGNAPLGAARWRPVSAESPRLGNSARARRCCSLIRQRFGRHRDECASRSAEQRC